MTTRNIIQRVQALYSKGLQSDNTRLSYRHIYNKLVTARTRLIVQKLNKKQNVSDWFYQTIHCVELEKVPNHECPCIPATGCDILRSKEKLPTPLEGLNKHAIKLVTSADRSTKIDLIGMNAYKYQSSNKYACKQVVGFIENGYLYVSSPTFLKIVSVTGLFEDPYEVQQFETFCGDCSDCEECEGPLDANFPISADKIETVIEMATQELIGVFAKMPEDNKGNLNEDN